MASKEDDKSKEGKKEEGGDGKDGDGKDEKKGLDKLTSGLAAGLNVVKPQEKRPKLVKGNYMVHVHIIEARDLIGAGMGDMSDPVARIEVMGKKQHTKIVKKALNVLWDEVLVFEFKDLEPEEIERGKCVIRILDANTFRSDVLIGLFEFDLSQVYFSPHHELYRQWCALTDTTDKREGIQGYLKFSLTVLGPNDEQFIHSAADADDDDGGMLGVMMPPEVEQHGKILRIQALYVADLPLMDEKVLGFGGGCDPYVRVEFAGVDIKTKHFKGQTAEMLQELLVPVMEPTMSTGIKLSVMDWDQAGSDDRIAVLTFDYADIKDHPEKYQRHRWYQLYGSPEPNSNAEMLALVQLKGHSAKEKMDKGFIPGSYYRGRIMLNFMVEDSKEPKKDVITCNGLLESQRPEEIQWKIEFDLYEGSEIPEKGSKIAIKSTGKAQIEVVCGRPAATTSTISEKKEVVEGQCQWYSPLKDIVVQMPKDPEQCPDIFVYLVISGKRVSFIRFPFAAMVARGWEVPPAWHILVEDPVLDALTEQEFPGAILFSMRVGPFASAPPEPGPKSRPLKYDIPASELGGGEYGVEDPLGSPLGSPTPSGDEKDGKGEPDLLRSPTFSKKYEEGKVSKVGTLTLELVEATNLPALDRGGTSDPFVKFEMGSYKFQSAVKNKTLNPKWNQTFTFKDVSVETPLRFEVFDHDTLSNDKMGDCNVDIRSMQLASKTQMGTDFTHDAWFFLSNTKATNAQVRLKFGFKYVSLAESATLQAEIEKKQAKKEKSFLGLKIPGLKKKQTGLGPGAEALGIPERRAYQLRCHIFQARSLPALDSNGLADPYVVIRVAGKKIKLDRKEKTLNPQWYITKDINITLPIPLHFAPKIQCFVYDWDQVGRDEPLGRFALTCLEASTMNPSLEEINPKWFPLTDFEGKAMDESKVLASFQLVTADDAARAGTKITDIRPPTTPMFIEIVTLGLRSLQSTLGVHKTFINFELPNGKRFATRQSNRPTAKSPNFLQVLKLPCDLPTKAIFAPTLLIEVRDVLFGGLIKRLIGTSALDMSQFMIKSDEKGEGAGDWKPAERVTLISDEDVERQIKDDEMKKREAELKAKLDEEKRKMDEDEKKEKDEKVRIDEEEEKGGTEKKVKKKDDLKEPLLQDPSSSSSSGDVKVEVKDDGTGVGDIKDKGAGDPLLGGDEPMDAKAVKKEFDKADKVFDTLDLASAGSIPDEPEEIPKYMKGRVTVDDELEDTMTMKPFHKITVATGQKNAGKFSMNKWRKVGTFKGLVRLFDEKNPGTEFDTKELLNPVEMYCRLYILRGLGLTPKDSNGKSDPYLIIKLGKTKISTRDRYIKDTLAPDFYESFEIPCTIPGDAELEITCMDWDGIGDDLIGSTKVDIEDRWFTKEWRAMPLKPLERRTLRTASSTQGQGKLEMWVELLKPEQAKREPMLNIKPPAPDPFELRLIIWGVRDVPIKDELTKQNDLYVTCSCSVPGLKKQETDTHWRSKKGKGNFNWRMKFPLSLPIVPWPRLRFQIWDRDIFSPNDSIAELVISVKALCKMAQKKKNRVKAILKGKDRFYLEGLRHPNFKGSQGKMEISLEVLPLAMASQLPAGPGRSDPNANCFLPEPEGRVNWSLLHPFDMLKEILGPELYRKICLGCCCMLFTAACVFMAPMIVSNLITNIIT